MIFEDMEFGSYDKAEHKAHKAFELYEDGKMSQALEELETALEINPSNSSWHFNKALTLDAISRFDDAITEYEIALQLNPDDLEILNSLAVDYTRTGQYDLAIDTFEHIQELDPAFEPCYCNRIITYTEMGQHDLAEQMFYLAQQINPDCALCYYNIGNSLFARGLYKRAIRCWLRTAELEPSHPQINYRIAQAYWSEGDNKRAREHLLVELRVNPGDIDVILDFGLFLLEVGDIESAKEKFNRILELKPDSALALFYLGEIAFDNGDYEQGVDRFKQALQQDDTLPGPYYRLAQYALMKDKKKQARTYLLSELRLGPENGDTLVSMASMFLTIGEERHTQQDVFAETDLDHATHCLLRAIDLDFADADAHYYLGLISAVRGRLEDAAEFFSHTLDIDSEHIAALRDSAFVYLAMGRFADAVDRISKAKALAGNDRRLRTLARRIRIARAMERAGVFLCRFSPLSVLRKRLR
jgi:tetratricopeptide (TPR) repeat protein